MISTTDESRVPAIKLYIDLIFLFLLPCRQLFVFFSSIGITNTNSDFGAKVPMMAIACSMLEKTDIYFLLIYTGVSSF